MRGAKLQSLLVLSIRIGGAALQMLLVAAVAIRFPVEAVGLNGLVWATALVARAAGTFGLDTTGVRAQAPLWAGGRADEARAVAQRDVRALLRIWCVLLVIAAAASGAVQVAGGPGAWILIFAAVAVASAFGRLFMVQRMARQHPLAGQFLESVALPGLALAGALIASAAAPTMLIPSQVAAFVLVCAAFWWMSPVRGARGTQAQQVPPVPWRQALTLGAGSALTAFSVRGPMFLLGSRSLAMAGAYEVAQKIQSGAAMGTTAVTTVFLPRIAVAVTDARQLVRLVLEAAAASVVLPLGLLGFLLVVGEEGIVGLLGEDYQGTWGAAVILVLSTLINAVTSTTSNALMLGGRERLFLWISASQLALVVGGAWLAGTDTAVGMAWWMLGGEVLRSIAMVVGFAMLLRNLGRSTGPKHRAD